MVVDWEIPVQNADTFTGWSANDVLKSAFATLLTSYGHIIKTKLLLCYCRLDPSGLAIGYWVLNGIVGTLCHLLQKKNRDT
jgi:hypothetical protein